ncbi:uncharacterized protein LOC129732939 [Wyeomyia smithii]|uniref:uncharacterized protein LOC129732939 n=1 Tax=Wyeomyia smithii TaxID=174621 RepID=UPI002467BAC9|nr:uncharacterized protein LOC129732939 [Wyeomyia smithii]
MTKKEASKKSKDVENLLKELEDTKTRMLALEQALKQERAQNEALKASMEKANNTNDEGSVDFSGQAPRSSSTQRTEILLNPEESRFVTSVNQLSVSSLNVPECVPLTNDGEITRQSFDTWKDLLIDSMKLAGIEDEATQFILFRVKAGSRLLGIFKNTKSTEDSPSEENKPFSNAMHRLKVYFGSSSDIMLQRRKLTLITQKPDESDLQFVNKVTNLARLCEFNECKETEEIIGTIAGQAQNREVRTAALKILNRGGSVTDLVDNVREIETIRLNEEYFRKKTLAVRADRYRSCQSRLSSESIVSQSISSVSAEEKCSADVNWISIFQQLAVYGSSWVA